MRSVALDDPGILGSRMARRKHRRSPKRTTEDTAAHAPTTVEDVSRLRRSGIGVGVIEMRPTPDMLQAELRNEAIWLKELPDHVARVKALFAGHDAFDVLACIWWAQLANNSLPAPARDPFLAAVAPAEYAAMILVERAGRQPTSSVPLMDLAATFMEACRHLLALTRNVDTALSRYLHGPDDEARAALHRRFVERYIWVPINETDEQARTWLRRCSASRLSSAGCAPRWGSE
jgi:hypothetical protein